MNAKHISSDAHHEIFRHWTHSKICGSGRDLAHHHLQQVHGQPRDLCRLLHTKRIPTVVASVWLDEDLSPV
jgi:hypothetical protein